MVLAELEKKLAQKLSKTTDHKRVQDALRLASEFGKKPPIVTKRDNRKWSITSGMPLDRGN